MDRIYQALTRIMTKARQFLDLLLAEKPAPLAAAQGLVFCVGSYIMLYAIGVSLFVIWKWDLSKTYDGREQLSPSLLDSVSMNHRLMIDPDASIGLLDQRLVELESSLGRHQDNTQQARAQLESLQNLLEDSESILRIPIPDVMTSNLTDAAESLEERTTHLRLLLDALPDRLEEVFPSQEDLRQGIALATKELHELIDAEDTNWELVADLLQSLEWQDMDWSSFDATNYCSSDKDATTTAEASFTIADQAYINELVQSVRGLLATQVSDNALWRTALPETQELFERTYQDRLNAAQNQLASLASELEKTQQSAPGEVSTALGECPMTKEKVVALVNAGLDALYRQQDLRQVLGVNEDDANPVAMDAAWKPAQETYPESINLRRVIDTPLLKKTAQWIDNALDLAGGYSDYVDSKIDALTQGRDEFGAVLVDYLLRQSGKVRVPVPTRIQAKKTKEQTARRER
jgi:hypothetical protein